MSKIRTRFAPSPTGFLHVGGLRTALFNYLFAKQNRGDFILRIEDTDKTRYVDGATEGLLKILKNVGLEYDEGPDVGGKFGPYVQSERLNLYKNYAEELVAKGRAYYCFCAPERLDTMRSQQIEKKQPPMYDRHCLNLSDEDKQNLLDKNTPHVIRLLVPRGESIKFNDLVRGEISIETDTIDDQVLLKSDGYPTYHLANVVDDHLMKISHVIRGEEWLPSTPKHILLYRAFDWDLPKFAHLPLLLNKDKTKLSKRQGDVAVEDYLRKGYLPEALINFVALLGWNPGTDEELFTLKQLVKKFKLGQVNKSGAVFDTEKLDWLNGNYIRQLKPKDLVKKIIPYIEGKNLNLEYLEKIVELEQERLKRLDEIAEETKYFFQDKIDYETNLLVWKKLSYSEIKENLELTLKTLQEIPDKKWDKKYLEKILMKMIKDNKKGTGDILWPLRVALTGLKASPGPFEVAEVLGKEKSLKRVNEAVQKLT